MDLEDIMLSEISQKERQILCDLTYIVDSKKPELIGIENRLVVARDEGRGLGEKGEAGQRVQIYSYKSNRLWVKCTAW